MTTTTSSQPESPQPVHETNTSATTPLLENAENKVDAAPLVVTVAVSPPAPASPGQPPVSPTKTAQANVNEYRFVHLRIPPRDGNLRFLLPILLLVFQLVFIILFAFFADYSTEPNNSPNRYPSRRLVFDPLIGHLNNINPFVKCSLTCTPSLYWVSAS